MFGLSSPADLFKKSVSCSSASVSAGLLVFVLGGSPVLAAAPDESSIGTARTIVKEVQAAEITTGDDERFLAVKDAVFQDEYVETRDVSATKLKFIDDTELTLGPKSRVQLDEFVFDTDVTKQKMVLNFAKGVARFVSGKMAKNKYEIKTPTATIGIRGTVVTMSITDEGTDLFVQSGEAFVTSVDTGIRVDVPAGHKTSVKPNTPPSTPAPAPGGLEGIGIVEMDALIEIAGDGPGLDEPTETRNEEEEQLFEVLEESEDLREGHGCSC